MKLDAHHPKSNNQSELVVVHSQKPWDNQPEQHLNKSQSVLQLAVLSTLNDCQ